MWLERGLEVGGRAAHRATQGQCGGSQWVSPPAAQTVPAPTRADQGSTRLPHQCGQHAIAPLVYARTHLAAGDVIPRVIGIEVLLNQRAVPKLAPPKLNLRDMA